MEALEGRLTQPACGRAAGTNTQILPSQSVWNYSRRDELTSKMLWPRSAAAAGAGLAAALRMSTYSGRNFWLSCPSSASSLCTACQRTLNISLNQQSPPLEVKNIRMCKLLRANIVHTQDLADAGRQERHAVHKGRLRQTWANLRYHSTANCPSCHSSAPFQQF